MHISSKCLVVVTHEYAHETDWYSNSRGTNRTRTWDISVSRQACVTIRPPPQTITISYFIAHNLASVARVILTASSMKILLEILLEL